MGLLTLSLIVIARLLELQILQGKNYHQIAQAQQYGGVVLPAKRGEILSRNSKTNDVSILATNTTLDLLYIDPLTIGEHHGRVADALSDILITNEIDSICRKGLSGCPSELITYYQAAFNPLRFPIAAVFAASSGSQIPIVNTGTILRDSTSIENIGEIRRHFSRDIEEKIRQTHMTFVPLLYGANKLQQQAVNDLHIPGITVNAVDGLVFANPEQVDQDEREEIAGTLSKILQIDPSVIINKLQTRKLRYVPIMGRLPPKISLQIRQLKDREAKKALAERERIVTEARAAGRKPQATTGLEDPFRSVALIAQHWRFYPDTRIASHVVGFINTLEEPQYGVERAYDTLLKGQEGLITSVSDPFGRQILSSDQTFIDPKDGATIVLTIDRFIQSKVEELLEAMVKKVDAESGQVVIIEPKTGRIIAMANAPLFDSNSYASVYEREPIYLDETYENNVVIEVYDPTTNVRVLKSYLPDLKERRSLLSPEKQQQLSDLEKLYDLHKITRYYLYIGDNNRREIFKTQEPHIWLKYRNNIGVGSYINRAVQEIYEPGSVMKAITMAIAIDQGEVVPSDIYNDEGPVKVDVFTIKNALNKYYGKVTMVDCINFSINTCMTSVSKKLGRKLFHSALDSFGFGHITGIELDSELPGDLKSWRDWNDALVLTMSYGQGISVTPIQMVTTFAALANQGKLMKPTIIDELRQSDGTVEKRQPAPIAQVIKPETAATITAMLTNSAENGFAKAGKVKGHRIAGKTGTSQIAGPGGKYETGTGSTIATYAGFAPVDDPKFVVLVKLDRPKKDDFGSKSAAPLFKDIAAFLFEYYGLPPDEKR